MCDREQARTLMMRSRAASSSSSIRCNSAHSFLCVASMRVITGPRTRKKVLGLSACRHSSAKTDWIGYGCDSFFHLHLAVTNGADRETQRQQGVLCVCIHAFKTAAKESDASPQSRAPLSAAQSPLLRAQSGQNQGADSPAAWQCSHSRVAPLAFWHAAACECCPLGPAAVLRPLMVDSTNQAWQEAVAAALGAQPLRDALHRGASTARREGLVRVRALVQAARLVGHPNPMAKRSDPRQTSLSWGRCEEARAGPVRAAHHGGKPPSHERCPPAPRNRWSPEYFRSGASRA